MEDLQEDEVWAVMWGTKESSPSSTPTHRRRSSAARPISQARHSAPVMIRRLSGGGAGRGDEDSEPEQEEDSGMVPPHQWIARRLAKKQIPSFSMCEGAGRTLKGRDLSRVRNAVLTRTGFLEPPAAPPGTEDLFLRH